MGAPLAHRVALVTGGAARLGREIAMRLAAAGADVAISYLRSETEAAQTRTDIERSGRRSVALRCDLRDAGEIDALVDGVHAALGPVDLLVLNAAVFRRTPLEDATAEDWDFHMESNARSAYLCARRVGLSMRERGSGAIVAIADVAGIRPWPSYIPYSASKAALLSLVQGLAIALAPQVRVNAVAPGPILTPAGQDEAGLRRSVARTLLQRQGTPADIADAVVYLATAPYVTGVILPVDGGRHLA